MAMVDVMSNFVKSLNPSLLQNPPPHHEVSGSDVCLLGPNGEDDPNSVTYCKDLVDGLRQVTGSWYLNPEQHAKEWIVTTLLCVITLVTVVPRLQHHTTKTSETNSEYVLRPPLVLRVIALANVLVLFVYKILGYPGKILMFFMPCNLNWLMLLALSWYPYLGCRTSHVLSQMAITMSPLAVVALATPDLSDLLLPLEIPHFFASHVLLLVYPLYFVMSGRITTLPHSNKESFLANFWKWHLVGSAIFAMAYYTFITPLSIVTGLNLNYMLNPPRGMGIGGSGYRSQVSAQIFAGFFATRALFALGEAVTRRVTNKPFQAKGSSTDASNVDGTAKSKQT